MEKLYCIHCAEPLNPRAEICTQCGGLQEEAVPYHHLLPGTVLNGRYWVGTALGEGGFGITYIGRDMTLNRRVAIKEYYPSGFATRNNTVSGRVLEISQSPTQVYQNGCDKFLGEAKVVAGFSDIPNIVAIHDVFRANDTAYIVMEYLTGESLKKHLETRGPVPYGPIMAWFFPLLKALEQVHAAGVIHRDISPDNLILMPNGTLKLIDFGAAREVLGAKSLSVVLKPGYAPIEQYSSSGKQGPWTDIYALCGTIYKCITGVTPPESTDRIVQDTLRRPSEMGITLPVQFEAILMKGLSIRAEDRYQTMAALLEDLGRRMTPPIEPKGGPLHPDEPRGFWAQWRLRLTKLFRQNKKLLVLLGSAAAVVVILVAMLIIPSGQRYPALPDDTEIVGEVMDSLDLGGTVLSYEVENGEIDMLYNSFVSDCSLLVEENGEASTKTATVVFQLAQNEKQWECVDVIPLQ